MLSITSSPLGVWPSAPAAAAVPVSAVPAVAPVSSAARDAQAGLGQGDQRPVPASVRRVGAQPAEAAKETGLPEAAPLLPRESPDSPEGEASAELTEAQAQAERDKAAGQAEDKALKQQLQDVLSNVWKASAAVVDVVLGREGSAAEAQAGGTAAELGSVAAAPQAATPGVLTVQRLAPAPLLGAGGDAANDGLPAATVFETRTPQDVVAYDAHGNSSWAPLEAGSLISRRV